MGEFDPKELKKIIKESLSSLAKEKSQTKETVSSKKEYIAITKQQIEVLRGLSGAFQPLLLVQNTESGIAAKAKKEINDRIQSRRVEIETMRTEEQTRVDLLSQKKKDLAAKVEQKITKDHIALQASLEKERKINEDLRKSLAESRNAYQNELDVIRHLNKEKEEALILERELAQAQKLIDRQQITNETISLADSVKHETEQKAS